MRLSATRFILRKAPDRQRQQRHRWPGELRGAEQSFATEVLEVRIDKGRAVDLFEKPEIGKYEKPRG